MRKPEFDSETRDLDGGQGGFMLRWALAFFHCGRLRPCSAFSELR